MKGGIKVYKSTDTGAKLNSGQSGALIAILDDVLVNGYGGANISSIIKVNNVATVNTTGPHGFNDGDICKITGSDQSAYNNEFEVTLAGSNAFTIPIPNEAPNSVTGTMRCVKAPLGFTKPFSGANKAVYRSSDPTSNRFYLRVVDDASGANGGAEASFTMAEVMTGTDTWDTLVPSPSRVPAGYLVAKSNVSTTAARHWMIIGNSKLFYLFCYFNNNDVLLSSGNISNALFGDVISYSPNDAWNTVIGGHAGNIGTQYYLNNPIFSISSSNPYTTPVTNTNLSSYGHLMLMRDYSGGIGGKSAQVVGSGYGANSVIGSSSSIPYPNGADGGFYMVPVNILQGEPNCLRGRLPGVYDGLHGRCFGNTDIFTGVAGFPGRKFMSVYGSMGQYNTGVIYIDITGPWE